MFAYANGPRIAELRANGKWSQTEFAAHVGELSQKDISRMERCERLHDRKIALIAKKFNIPLAQLALAEPPVVTGVTVAVARANGQWVNQSLQDRLTRYLSWLHERTSHIRMVISGFAGEAPTLPIHAIYVEPRFHTHEWPANEAPKNDSGLSLDAVLAQRLLVLLAPGGMGKSTLGNVVVNLLSDPRAPEVPDGLAGRIPILLTLRDLAPATFTWAGLWQAMLAQNVSVQETLQEYLGTSERLNLEQAINDGKAWIYIDGLDEVPLEQWQKYVHAIHDGISKCHDQNHWVITSRLLGFQWDSFNPEVKPKTEDEADNTKTEKLDEVRQFPFERYYVLPLSDLQVEEFAEKWYQRRDPPKQAEINARDLQQAIVRNVATRSLSRNVYQLTLMVVIHRLYAHLPDGRVELYHRIAEAYIHDIPLFKKQDTLRFNVADVFDWLGMIGFTMQCLRTVDTTLIAIDGVKLTQLLQDAMRKTLGPKGNNPQAVQQLLLHFQLRAGLIQPGKNNEFTFSHLSFQEFFAAWYIAQRVAEPRWQTEPQDYPEGLREAALRDYVQRPQDWGATLELLYECLAKLPGRPGLMLAQKMFPDLKDSNWKRMLEHRPDRHGKKPLTREHQNYSEIDLLQRLGNNTHTHWDRYPWKDFGGYTERIGLQDKSLAGLATEGYTLWLLQEKKLDTTNEVLDLSHCHLSNLEPLRKYTFLKDLNLDLNAISDLSPLHGLVNLQYLLLGANTINDISPLQGLVNLKVLWLRSNAISDLSPLQGLVNLKDLILSSNAISDLSPLQGLVNLKELLLSENTISDLLPLRDLPILELVDISGNSITSADVKAFHAYRKKAGLNAVDIF